MVRGRFPVRCELMNGSVMIRGLPDLEHGTLCKAFSLDPCSTWFDLPSSWRGTGSNSGMKSTRLDGLVFQGPKGSDPIGKITVASASDKFADVDYTNPSDFFRLG
jgi:hypothetical protein